MIYVTRIDKDTYTIEVHDVDGTTIFERKRFANETLEEFEKRVQATIDLYYFKTNN